MFKDEFIIRTKRLILRPLEVHDLYTAHAYASDIENTKYMIYLPNNQIQETEQFLKKQMMNGKKKTPLFMNLQLFWAEHILERFLYISMKMDKKENWAG